MADGVFDAVEFDVCRAISTTGDPAVVDDFEAAETVHRTPGGGLAWTSATPPLSGTPSHPWLVTTEVVVAGRSLYVTIETPNALVTAAELDAGSQFLLGLNDIAESLIPVVAEDLKACGIVWDLVHDLFEQLPPMYLAQLFPACPDADAVTAEAVVNALVACDAKLSLPETEFAVGYRLLVDTLTDEDHEADTAMAFGDCFDVTGQVLVVTTRTGLITGVRIDS